MRKLLLAVTLIFLLATGVSHAEKNKYFGATFPATFILYIMDPDRVAGWNGPLRGYEIKYIPEKYQQLPIIGGWYGQGVVPDREMLLRADIDKALVIASGGMTDGTVQSTLRSLNIEMIIVEGATMQDYIDIFRMLGRELHMEERGEALSSYAENMLERVKESLADLPEEEILKIYFAQGADGLETICDNTYRADAIVVSGGKLVHQCAANSPDIVTISFEQLMAYDPDVILVQSAAFANRYKTEPKWQRLRAVRNGRIYEVPYEPFSWLDRPPSYMRFIGVPWLVCKLHPDRCDIDIEDETRKFLNLFFHLDLSEQEVKGILTP